MKLYTVVKIAITSSVALLCAGFALYFFLRLSAADKQKDFNLYTLVPSSASAVFVTDDTARLIAEMERFSSSREENYLYASKLFSHLAHHFNAFSDDIPHGVSRQMNQVVISFHAPFHDDSQILYCNLSSQDHALITNFIQRYTTSPYQPRTRSYRGEEMTIYPLNDGSFLACYLTSNFLVLSYQSKLIEEVIDVRQSSKSLAADSNFARTQTNKPRHTHTAIYAKKDGTGWTKYELKLQDDFMYLSGTSPYTPDEERPTFINMLRRQEPIQGTLDEWIPASAFYFDRQATSDWASALSFEEAASPDAGSLPRDSISPYEIVLTHFLTENGGRERVLYRMHGKDSLMTEARVLSIVLTDQAEAERVLYASVANVPPQKGERNSRFSYIHTPEQAHLVCRLPQTSLFARLSQVPEMQSMAYSLFYKGRLLLAPNVESLSYYIEQLEKGQLLMNQGASRQFGFNSLSDPVSFLSMSDLEYLLAEPEIREKVREIPNLFYHHPEFFRHFNCLIQIAATKGEAAHTHIVLRYKRGE